MIRAYLSHPIRGAKGSAATHEDKEANNARAIMFAARVRAEVPGLDLWVPAEHEEFMQHAEDLGILTDELILAVDRKIVQSRDILIVYAPESFVSAGMCEEIMVAQAAGKPWAYTTGALEPIGRLLEGFLG
jgi:hypothetical protein